MNWKRLAGHIIINKYILIVIVVVDVDVDGYKSIQSMNQSIGFVGVDPNLLE